MVVRRSQAGRLADRAVDVKDDTTRPAHDMMMVIADASLEPDRAARRLDAADEARLGQRMQSLVYGLQGDMAHPVTHPGSKCLGPEMITMADRFKQRDTGSGYPQSGAAELLGGSRRAGLPNTNTAIKRTIQV
jgi:hypothetical protein